MPEMCKCDYVCGVKVKITRIALGETGVYDSWFLFVLMAANVIQEEQIFKDLILCRSAEEDAWRDSSEVINSMLE